MTNDELWKLTLSGIEAELSHANFATWFAQTAIMEQTSGKIVIGTPSAFVKEWLENKYMKLVLKYLRTHAPEVRSLEFSILSQGALTPSKAQLPKPHEEQMDMRELYVDKDTNLNPRYTFETFVVGRFNEIAHAAALAVTEKPGVAYNPLYIYGGVGLGKTHLLQSIGNRIRALFPAKRVYYVSTDRFANDIMFAIRTPSEKDAIKEKYRSFDLLILDDVQFIANRTASQEEMFHIFNAMSEANKQIVFSSDRPPKSIINLDDRLRSRFEGGMMADVVEPDYETRLAILQAKAIVKEEYRPAADVLEYTASVIQTNIRELEGALNTIVANSKIRRRPLSIEEVKDILSKNTKPRRSLSAQHIIKSVAQFYDVPERYLFEKTRRKEVVRPRQVAMFLLREDFSGSYPYIGQKFGGRDHTTAIHAYLKISGDMKKDERLREEIKTIRSHLYDDEKS
ncbi:MAG: chromosomal replication initiator protein DnaA [Candidatus Niyogibacteria bacterium]|nr:chromosomal replication initiator protein DnaA [Candidatus Niyogibacteria bacterium]